MKEQIKTYTVKQKKDGGSWKNCTTLLAVNFTDAKKEFVAWAKDWLGQSDSILAETKLELMPDFFDTFSYDGTTYTIRRTK
jgi:hypothetical protein